MRIAVTLAGPGPALPWHDVITYVEEAERLGADDAWSAEAWARDAITPLAYLAARTSRIRLGTGILAVGTRTPAMTAMTASTLCEISGGRFALGLGASGPQVIEGVHGFEFKGQLERLKETIDIARVVFRGDPLTYQGDHYALPRPGGEARRPLRGGIPCDPPAIYVGAMSPAGLRLTGAAADGWLGHHFIPEAAAVYLDPLREGAKSAGRTLEDLDLQAGGWIEFGDDLEALVDSRRAYLAFNLGAMGSARKNFYNDVYVRAGFEDAALEIQKLWLSGKRDDARKAVPDEMVLQSQLIGDESRLRERFALFRSLGIDTIRLQPAGANVREQVANLERAIALVRSLD